MKRYWATVIAVAIYEIGAIGTLVTLLIDDFPRMNYWNWIALLPVNISLAQIWPIYWTILRPLFGS